MPDKVKVEVLTGENGFTVVVRTLVNGAFEQTVLPGLRREEVAGAVDDVLSSMPAAEKKPQKRQSSF